MEPTHRQRQDTSAQSTPTRLGEAWDDQPKRAVTGLPLSATVKGRLEGE